MRLFRGLFHAMGFHVPDNNIVYFDPDQLEIGEDVQLALATGKPRKMTSRDLTEILMKAPKTRDKPYRATASLALPGKDRLARRATTASAPTIRMTSFRTSTDAISAALHVIDAWLDHDDSRAINSIDIAGERRRPAVRSALPARLRFDARAAPREKPNSPRSGAYFFGWKRLGQAVLHTGLGAALLGLRALSELSFHRKVRMEGLRPGTLASRVPESGVPEPLARR